MFNYLKKIFTEPLLSITVSKTTETWGGTRVEQDSLGHEFGESIDGTATLRQMKNGKFRLLVNTNEVVGTYARRRDAVRGATRKGLVIDDS